MLEQGSVGEGCGPLTNRGVMRGENARLVWMAAQGSDKCSAH